MNPQPQPSPEQQQAAEKLLAEIGEELRQNREQERDIMRRAASAIQFADQQGIYRRIIARLLGISPHTVYSALHKPKED